MEFTPATQDDLAGVDRAAAEFCALWESLRSMPWFGEPFGGGLGDIRALDYLDYEGIGYPPGGVSAAALVWGRVLARQTGLEWARCSLGGLWLWSDVSNGGLAVWPLARVGEAQARFFPQFGKYAALTERVLGECLEVYSGSGEIEGRLERLRADLVGE
ncbi:hypothetical protein EP7_004528 [Isosphaeraceae bacterium EP7]